ncbi:MoaD/ThiS family protein [Paludibacterium denitrificans]|uniref:Molybdopterin synthase sulfur carrier subunit n=1 Tax=Paludibacterium denitrificans TaxID=2675226 RepID=A0A844GBW8_9NEIS|nr:MoaD/ThiS family protein [Paludibacterium denitrificans]MTD32274.1 molybdopterin synthase sulfur carrier subunit [Paludibacterium denitrificans]
MMSIRVLDFARLRDVLGSGEEVLALPNGATLADLVAMLVERGGDWACGIWWRGVFRAAINQNNGTALETWILG